MKFIFFLAPFVLTALGRVMGLGEWAILFGLSPFIVLIIALLIFSYSIARRIDKKNKERKERIICLC